MRILIAEDDFASRKFMHRFLSKYGDCDITVNGVEAVDAFQMALEDDEAYDLLCLDIMMPELDGYKTLERIREIEDENNVDDMNKVKVIITTALSERRYVDRAFQMGCVAYAGKPIDLEKFEQVLAKLDLIQIFDTN